MKDETLYALSKTLKLIRNETIVLNKSDWYAYHNLVDSSQKGFDCGYAKRLKVMGYEEKEFNKFINAVNEIEKSIKKIKGILDEDKKQKVSDK